MRRSLADARQHFEESIVPGLSDHQAKEARKVLEAEEQQARARAGSFIEKREQAVLTLRTEALKELTEVREEMEALASEGSLARIEAAEYEGRLAFLKRRKDGAEAQLAKAEEMIDGIEEIEQDPIAWADDLDRRMERRRDWPF